MIYTYDKMINKEGKEIRVGTTTDFNDIRSDDLKDGFYIQVTDNRNNKIILYIMDQSDLEEWQSKLERDQAWQPHKPWDPLSPEETDIRKVVSPEEMKKQMSKAYGIDVKMKGFNIDPNHYKNYIADLQWLDAMSEIPTLRDKERFSAAIELQVRKYLDRREQKNDSFEEVGKALVYLAYWYIYLKRGTVKMEDIQNWIRQL